MYRCTVTSHSSLGVEYLVESRSALKAAEQFGRAEYGEQIRVYSLRSGKLLSLALWDASTRRYFNACKGID